MKILVSVIIPNYNHAAYLPQRIETVRQQTLSEIEMIILDDCSTDNSRAIIEQHALNDSRVRTFFNAHNSGSPFKQWAKGLAQAKGDYIWIAESDDYAELTFLEKTVRMLNQNLNAGVAYSQSWLADDTGKIIDSCRNLYTTVGPTGMYPGQQLIETHMAGANLIPNASAAVFRRGLALQMDDSYQQFRFSGDWWFWCQLLAVSDLIYIDEELNYFRSHPQKITVAAHLNQTFVIETLQVLGLLRAKGWISEQTYQNKSKNAATQLSVAHEAGKRALSVNSLGKVLWYAFLNNRTFLRHLVKTWLR